MKRTGILLTTLLFLLAGCSSGENKEAATEKGEEEVTNSGDYQPSSPEQKEEKVSSNNSYTSVTSDEALGLLAKGDTVIIDVRKQESFLEAHIPNAQNIPLDALEAKLVEMDKNDTYLMVCKTGKTSVTAIELLAKNGFDHLYNLSGGMEAWTGDIE